MTTITADDLRRWFSEGVNRGAAYMLVVCDTFDWEDAPVYVMPEQDLTATADSIDGHNMQMIMECYDLRGDIEQLMRRERVWNGWHPKRGVSTNTLVDELIAEYLRLLNFAERGPDQQL